MGPPGRPLSRIPRLLTVAGSDSGGGAGVQADLKTFFAHGCHGMSAFTALTAQSTVGVTGIHEVPPDFVALQIDAVAQDIGVDAAKTGMLATKEIVEVVARSIEQHELFPLVVDPVFVSKHKDRLLAEEAVSALTERLFPLATVVTPNLHETSALLGGEVTTLEEMKEAARALREMGPRAVLVKGGHLGGASAIDVYWDGVDHIELEGPRFDTEDTHGTGDTLAASIAARLALGAELVPAIRAAKEFVAHAIDGSLRLGHGYGPVNQGWNLPAP